jgi:hypothetical protein
MFGCMYSTNTSMGILLYTSQQGPLHLISLRTSLSSAVYYGRVSSTSAPDATVSDMKCVGSKVYIEDTCPHTILHLVHHYEELH